MRRWSLGQLTVIGVRPAELVEIAARAGYHAVCPIVGLVPVKGLDLIPLRAGDPDTKAMAASLKSNGIQVQNADGYILGPDTDRDEMQRMTDLMAEFGARNINAIVFDEDLGRGAAQLAALDSMAQAVGMTISLEFMAFSPIVTPQQAMDLIATTGSANIGIMLDALHLAQSGAAAGDCRSTDILGAQICDAPRNLSFEEYCRMAIEERFAPGEGELPLTDFMAVLPRELTCSVEVPRLNEPDLTVRAKRMLDLARQIDRNASAARA
jgi:sugar phosphate isomerase/epimerase